MLILFSFFFIGSKMTAVTVKLYSIVVKGGSMYVACQEFSSLPGMKREMVERQLSVMQPAWSAPALPLY